MLFKRASSQSGCCFYICGWLDVSVKKYSWLFPCAGEKSGCGGKLVVGGGTGIAAGAEEARTSERRFPLRSSQ